MGLQTFQAFSSKLVGVPYSEADCWKLCIRFYELIFHAELNHYFDQRPESREERRNLIYANVGDFVEVKDPSFGDLILINIRGIESHIGIVLDSETFLHTKEATGSIVDRIERYKGMISGYYRLQESPK